MGAITCFNSSEPGGNRFKKMVYQYDLVSGKVNSVAYQPGRADQFYHRYEYDAENSLLEVRTSRDFLFWEREAAYDYYRHGPLARTILGQNQVQGLDYAYTLQGWLKGVNSLYALPNSNGCAEGTAFENLQINDRSQNGSPAAYRAKTSITFEPGFETGSQDFLEAFIDPAAAPCTINSETLAAGDMGKDGTDSLIAKDAFGFTLHYFDENTRHDYIPIGASSRLISVTPPGFNFASLYNGNIGAMSVNIPQVGNPLLYNYRYDQLNRLKRMHAYKGLNPQTQSWEPVSINDYRENISYDPNGNIISYNRNGDAGRISMDSLFYSYKPNTNQLDKVIDEADDAAEIDYPKYNDLKKGQVSGNYQYDAIGNLIKDASEGITDIQWTVYGKIKSITKAGSNISYTYDATGNRISKTAGGKTTYYVRDANGNVMSVYEQNTLLKQTEIHLYGSSRLGIYNVDIDVQSCPSVSPEIVTFARGNKFFELSNHLGNVLATVSDKKVGFSSNGTTIDYYKAEVVNAQDYYPFGMMMPGRKYSIANTNYRFGFNGKENDNEVKGGGNQLDYGMRIYDSRLGRFLSVDPLTAGFPELTPYQFASNSPIVNIDMDGEEGMWYIYAKSGAYGSTTAKIVNGTEDGIKASLTKTYNFFTKDMWKAQTWKSAANSFGTICDITVGNMDGRNDQIAYNVIQPKVDNFNKEVVKGDAYSRSKYFSEVGTDILTAYVGSKGMSAIKGSAMGMVRGRLASSFYANSGFTAESALSHMEGIDFTKAVQTTTIKKGTIVQQWVGENGVGNYFTPLENGATKNLGISYESRTLKQFTLTEDVIVLKSTAAEYKGNAGGGTQYFSTEIKNKVTSNQ